MTDKVYMVPNPPMPTGGILFDPEVCNGCNICVNVCPRDCLMPNPVKRQPPISLYPDECWFCGACVEDCPRPGANELRHPLNQSVVVIWKRKDTGELFRLGMKDPPPANTRPPVG